MDAVTLILFLLGLGLLVAGAEVLVRGAAQLAAIVGVSPLVIGLTVVAFATSSPELAVSLKSTYGGDPDLALGNVIGSNIANILLILGISAVAAPLAVAQKLIRLDVPVMIGISVIVWLMAFDGALGRVDGAILTVLLIGYITWTIRESQRETRRVKKEYAEEYSAKKHTRGTILKDLALVAIGFGMLYQGAAWLVDGAVAFALWLGASKLIVGLTIVAIGTSLPELATSVVASLRGQRDIAVGTAIGSNILNLLSVLGLTALVAPEGIGIAPAALGFDLPVMIGVAVACMPILLIDYRINRWEGALFVAYYASYLLYLVLEKQNSPALPMFGQIMTRFALPVTGLTILYFLLRFLRKPREGSAG